MQTNWKRKNYHKFIKQIAIRWEIRRQTRCCGNNSLWSHSILIFTYLYHYYYYYCVCDGRDRERASSINTFYSQYNIDKRIDTIQISFGYGWLAANCCALNRTFSERFSKWYALRKPLRGYLTFFSPLLVYTYEYAHADCRCSMMMMMMTMIMFDYTYYMYILCYSSALLTSRVAAKYAERTQKHLEKCICIYNYMSVCLVAIDFPHAYPYVLFPY